MSKEIRADYTKQYLLPVSIEEWIPENHPARFIREFIELMDLEDLGFKSREAARGRSNFSIDLLLKVWLYGYMENIHSSRKLERACMNQIPLVWLTGNNAPDHNTLWRFYKDNRKAVNRLFRQSVKIATNAGLVEMVLHAVDGTIIKAHGSTQEVLNSEEIDRIINKIDASVNKMYAEVSDNEEKESGSYRLPEDLTGREKLRERLVKAKEKMEEVNRKQIHPLEDEARMMRCSGKIDLAYNAQAVVDELEGIIVAESVTNEENDTHQLTSMMDEVKENTHRNAEETLADGGYFSSEELYKAEENNYPVIINLREDYDDEFHWSRFKYEESDDCLICPLGKKLEFSYIETWDKVPARVYKCKEHRGCPRRLECSKHKKGRRVKLSKYHESMLRQKEKQNDVNKRLLLKRRKVIVEPAFGIIKQCMGFRRFTAFGLKNAEAQWSWICTVFNLKKLYKHWLTGTLITKHA